MDNRPASRSGNFGPRLNKSCDACQVRKVRCIPSSARGTCTICLKRSIDCHFSVRRPAQRKNGRGELPPIYSLSRMILTKFSTVAEGFLPSKSADAQSNNSSALDTSGGGTLTPIPPKYHQPLEQAPLATTNPENISISPLFIDRLISQATSLSDENIVEKASFFPKNGIFGGRHSLSFFSDSRLNSLSRCLQNTKVNGLVDRIAGLIDTRLRRNTATDSTEHKNQWPASLKDPVRVSLFIDLYFRHVHPVYPFLDIETWQATISRADFPQLLERSKPWSCLYHTVLALGSQHAHCGSFEPGKGEAWGIFAVALEGFSELVLLPDSLIMMQALTAMAVYGLGINGLAIEHVIMSEATRRAQSMSRSTFTGRAAQVYQKNFWLMYCLEKVNSFYLGRSSGFVDGDICCPIPIAPEATCASFHWFLPLIQFARLISKAYTHLYSVSVSSNSRSYYLGIIEELNKELELWRMSLPDTGFRSGGTTRPHQLPEPGARYIALMFHYLYNSFQLTLCRTAMWYLKDDDDADVEKKAWCTEKTLGSARAILEMTSIVEVEPYTHILVIAGIPIMALFIVFDLVIHNSHALETQTNLVLLDMAAGHFSRIEFASGGSLPGSLISEFAHIAREHVNRSLSSTGAGHPEAQQEVKDGTIRSRRRGSSFKVTAPAAQTGVGQINDSSSNTSNGLMLNPLDFEMEDNIIPPDSNSFMGTEVMDLFNYFLPDLDPMFHEGVGPYGIM